MDTSNHTGNETRRLYNLTSAGRRLVTYLDYVEKHPELLEQIKRWIIAHRDIVSVYVAQAYLRADDRRQGIWWLYEYIMYDKHAGRDMPGYQWDFELWTDVASWIVDLTPESLAALADVRPPAAPALPPEQHDDDRQPTGNRCTTCGRLLNDKGLCWFCDAPSGGSFFDNDYEPEEE